MKSHVRVLKFGGTSVGSGERIRHVASILADTLSDPQESFPVVVVSAMSGVTDQLLRIAHFTCSGEHDTCDQELKALQHKHLEAIEKAVSSPVGRATLRQHLETALAGLAKDITALRGAAHQGQEVGLATAAVAAWGERLCVLLVAAAACDVGIEAQAVRQEVIITGHPQPETAQPLGVVVGAEPLWQETRANAHELLSPLIERGIVPIAAGFIGRTITGQVTTLGRNGSDYSASVIGAALDCLEVTIYTDVDGVLTADPRLVGNTRLLPSLSYAESTRLSWFGAKVLHPRTLIPLAPGKIPVRVRNTFRPHVRGTVIGPEEQFPSGTRAITIRRHLALMTVESAEMFGAPENTGQVFALAARTGAAPVAICSSSGHHLSFVVEEQAVDAIVALLQQDMGNWRVRCQREVAVCACIGSGFSMDPMSPARASTALAHEGIAVMTQGVSEQGITFVVEDGDSESALRCLHRELIAPVIPLVRHPQPAQENRRSAL
jgi:aspartate kinase